MTTTLDGLPGFRRRLCVIPAAGRVTAALEDDFHCMAVTLRHDGETVIQADAVMERAPWSSCPGARAVLKSTFEGVALAAAVKRGDKPSNCTHLYDLALLAAAHALDSEPLTYEILASDPVDGRVVAEIRRNGRAQLRMAHAGNVMSEPEDIKGESLFKLRDWIKTLKEPAREAARLLQLGAIIAQGRIVPKNRQSDARHMSLKCYTFQPENAASAQRLWDIEDFSRPGARTPLDHFDGASFRSLEKATTTKRP